MGNKLEVIGANLVPDTPASFSSAPQQIAPVSALDDAKAAKKYDDNKFDKLFSWETPKAVLEGMPTMGILNVAADKISPYIPEVKISDTLSFGGQGPLITNSQPVTDERLEQYAKSMNVPEEYWQDLRASKDMTEVYTKTGRILSDIKGQQHLAQVYGSTALTMGSVFFDPTFYLGNEAGNLMAASVKSASIAKSLAAVGALKQTTVATKVAEAVSSMGKALPAQASAVASKAASVTEAAAGKSGGFLVDTLNYSGTNVLLGELDANVRGRETTPTEFYMNALVGAVAPHVIGALGKTYTASNAWLHNRTVKALNEIGAKAAQEKFQVEPTDKLNEMTIGEKVSHGDEAIEPRLSDTGPAQGELFDATGAHPKDPQLDSMVRALLGDEPVMTEGVTPEGQLELDFLGEPKRVPVETPEVAPVVETTPVVEAEPVASPDVPIEIVTPKELLRARPSYILDGVRFTPRFKSSIDKALFIVGQDARSAHDVKYMEMLRKVFPKLSDAEIREAGQGIKAQHMRSNAKVAIDTKGLPRGTDAELPVDTTWKDNVNPIGKDHEPMSHEVGPVVPKEGLQPEQVAELEKATPEVQQKVVQKVLDQKVADTPLRFNPKDAAKPYARDVEEISSLLEPLVVKDGNRLYTTLKEPLVINTEGASKGVIKLAKAVQNVDGPFVQGTTQDGKPVDFSLDELKAALTKTEPKVETTSYTPGKTAGEQKVEIKTDYGMNDHFTAALEADLNAWKARENIQDSDTKGYGWEIRKTGLHGALRLLTFFPGKGRIDFDIKSQAEGIAKIRGMIADAPNDQLNIQKRWDAFNEEASKVQQQVVQKDVAQKDGVSTQTDGINSYDAPGVSAIKELVAGKPVGPDGFVSVSMMTAREVSVYKKAAYTDPWGTGKKIPIAEKLKDIKKPIAILEIDPVPVRIPNEFFPDTGDFAYFRVKAQLPGKKTPQEVMLKAWSFEGTPKALKGNQAGFITPGVAIGLLAGTGLGVYAVGQASQGKDLKETLGSALSALGSIAIIGMTKGNKSVVEALAHGKTLADVVKLPEVKANPEAVTLKTAQGQDLKLIDLAAKTGRLTDGTPFHMGTLKLPFFGKTRVSDPSGEISAEIRNSDSETGRSLGNLIASSIAGHKTKGAMNHTTADVYAQSTAKSAIHAVGDAFDKGFIAWANRDGKVSPDFIKAYSKKLVTEFNDQVVRAKKGETEGVHPEAIKAAKAIADSEARLLQMAADLLKEGKARGVVAEGSAWDLTGQIVAEPTYVHRSASSRGLYELTASVGIEKVHLLIQRALQKGNPELSPQFAAEMAPAYAKTLASLEHYPGLKVNDMNPDELLQHIKDVTQLTPEKAEELSKLFMGHKAADGVSGILKKRTQLDDTFEMPTTDLQGNPVTISMRQLFNQDIRMNHAHWVNSVSGVLGMARVSLDAGVDLTHGATFQRLLDQMKGELLEKSVPYNRAMKQVDTIRDLHAKILGKQNAEGIFKPANEAIRLLNDTTTLLSHAGFVFSAGAELAAAVQRRGLEYALNDMPELGQVVKAALGGEIDDGLARSLITAHALGDHQTAAMQLGLEQGNLSGASGAVQTAIGQTAKMNFFSTATASTKYLAIKAALQELSDVARGVRTLTPEQWNHFKLRGMSQELLEEIKPALLKATAVDENGMLLTDGSGYRPLDMFKDNAKAAMDLHAHLERQGNAAASESSGAGETNRYMHNDIGRTLGKFQGTPLIMTAKLKGNLNNFDASVAASWITTSLGAALAYIMSTYVSNHGDQETMQKKLTTKEIAKAAFRNGFSGIAPNVIDLAATMTGQEAPFAGVTNSGRQGGVDVPAFRTIQRVKDTAATVGHALTGQQVTRAEAAQAVKTPLWALNAFIPFATAPLPKKREQAKQP